MGCDIHLYTEYRFKEYGIDKWICADHFVRNEYYYSPYNDGSEKKWRVSHVYDGRNYTLFGALAGVRSSEYEPIDMPRGLPDDVSKDVKKEAKRWGLDGHSHSWFTLGELLRYQKNHPTIECEGMISSEAQKLLDEQGVTPTSWCEYTNKPGWEWREWEEKGCILDYLIEKVKERMYEWFYIYDFYDEDKKEQMIKEHAEDFRIVFWFDN